MYASGTESVASAAACQRSSARFAGQRPDVTVDGSAAIERELSEPAAETKMDKAGFDNRGTGNGMLNADHVANRWVVAARHIAMTILGKLPGTRFKSRLFSRLFGISMGKDVGLACRVMLDPFDPSMRSFSDNVIVGYDSKIFVHAFTLNRQRVRPVKIGSNVLIGGFCVIAPGVTIGDGVSIAPGTIVSRSIPAGAIVTGNAMHIRRRPVESE